ncbi:MAG: hypothetical protein ACPL5F_01355 [Moorellaceae bacterium]
MPLSQEDIVAEAIISGRHTYQVETAAGVFTCHLRTFKDERLIAIKRDQLIMKDGGDPRLASTDTLNIYHIQATIEVLVDKFPPGFVLEAAQPEEIAELYLKIQQYEDSFRKNSSAALAEGSQKGGTPPAVGSMQAVQPTA